MAKATKSPPHKSPLHKSTIIRQKLIVSLLKEVAKINTEEE